MAKKKKQTTEEEVITDDTLVANTTVETPAPVKAKLSDAQIKELLKDYSRVTLKARGII